MTATARHRSLRVAAGGAAVLLIGTGVVVRDPEAIAIGVLLGVGLGLLRVRDGLLGRIALVALSVDVIGWMAPAAWSIGRHNDGLGALAVPLGLVVLSASVIAAAWRVPERVVALGGVALFVIALGGASAAGNDAATKHRAGELTISARHATFSTTTLQAPAGTITIGFRNHDLFWHTFTIDQLDVNAKAPLASTRVASFNASPGTYEFYCAIPGHKAAGMKGTLTVR